MRSNFQIQQRSESTVLPARARRKDFRPYAFYGAIALVAILPALIFNSELSRLFWFGDDFAFINDIRNLGFAGWFPQAFGENYLPIFKAYWSAIFFLGGGSSALAIEANWILHAINAVVLARILRLSNFSRVTAAAGATIFGIAAANVEVLTWSMGGSTILACTFFLLALAQELRVAAATWPKTAKVIGWIIAGTLSHARGVIAGPAFAAAALWNSERPFRERLLRAATMLAPSIAVGTTIFFLAPDNHQEVLGSAERLLRGARFGFWYFAANPYVALVAANGRSWTCIDLGSTVVITLGLLKAGATWVALKNSRGSRRTMVIVLATADLFTAALLGLGRSDGDPPLAMSSRYQYGSLICSLPVLIAAGVAIHDKFRTSKSLARSTLTLVATGVCILNLFLWHNVLPPWAKWRGDGTRKVLSSGARPEQRDLPGANFLTNEEARSLAKRFDLH